MAGAEPTDAESGSTARWWTLGTEAIVAPNIAQAVCYVGQHYSGTSGAHPIEHVPVDQG